MSANEGLSKASQKLVPPNPADLMVIRDLSPTLTTLSVPFSRFGLIKFGGRATLVKLQTGNVAVFSPVALTEEVKTKVSSLGSLKYIVAPDFEHHIFLSSWAKQYPEAVVIGMEGLPEKRERDPSTKGVKFDHVFTAGNRRDLKISEEFDAEFDNEYFHSHANKELVFCHKPNRTLIEADLLFNLPATEQYSKTNQSATSGIFTKLFGNLTGAQGEMIGQRRFVWYASGASDRKAFKESSERIMSWDFDRIIPCHGDVIETGGKSVFGKLTQWFREGK